MTGVYMMRWEKPIKKYWGVGKCLFVEKGGKASQPMTPVMHGESGPVYIQ